MRVIIWLYFLFSGVLGRELYLLDVGGVGKDVEKYTDSLGLEFRNYFNKTHAVVKVKERGRGLEKVTTGLKRHRFKFKYNINGYNGVFIVSATVTPDVLLSELVKKIPKPKIFKAHPNSGFILLRLKDPAYLNETIYQLQNLPFVEWFDLHRNSYKNDHFASSILKTTSPMFNYTGRGQIISIADTGVDFKHCAFSPSDHLKRYTLSDSNYKNVLDLVKSYNFLKDKHKILLYFKISYFDGLHLQETDFTDRKGGHGTHVAGLAAGDDSYCSNIELHTPKSDSKIIFLDMENSNSTDEHLTTPPLFTPFMTVSYAAGSRIFSNSWGSATCEYTITAMEMDRFVYHHPDYIILVAGGNSGPGAYTIGSPAVLKNGISVGASQNSHESFVYYSKNPLFWEEGVQRFDYADIQSKSYSKENLADFSSRGPTCDGRIKPDIICPGQYSLSSQAHGAWLLMQGTSMACPECARFIASVIEFIQMVHEIRNPTLDLVKGLVLNAAVPLKGTSQRLYLSRETGMLFTVKIKQGLDIFDQGFGLANFENIALSSFLQSEFTSFSPPKKYCFRAKTTSPISVTLTWIDPPAFVHSQKTLINNLNLLLVKNGAASVYGNHLNHPDDLNTVERVRILATEGDYITVYIFTENTPLTLLSPATSQKFTLVYSSTLLPEPCTSPCDEWAPPYYLSATTALPCDKDEGKWGVNAKPLCDLYSFKEGLNCTCISNKPCTLNSNLKGTQFCQYNGTFSECKPEYKFVSFNQPIKARGVRLLLNILEGASNSTLTWQLWLSGVLIVQFYFILYIFIVRT